MLYEPQPGPQTAFAKSSADIVFFGGGAGGGKSFSLATDVIQWLMTGGFRGLLVRKTFPEIMGANGIFELVSKIVMNLPGIRIVGGNQPEISWPKYNSRILFRHMQNEKDKYLFKGSEFAVIGCDEVDSLSETQFFYLLSRNRATCAIRPYMRATMNPQPGWVADLLAWWIDPDTGLAIPERSGIVRWFRRRSDGTMDWSDTKHHRLAKSFTFIPSKLADNKYLGEDYEASLANLTPIETKRLLECNWTAVPSAGDHFQASWCKTIYEEPDGVKWVRGWDKAATEDPKADHTVGVRYGRMPDGRFVLDLRTIVMIQKGPADVLNAMHESAERDGLQTEVVHWQDPAQAGVVDRDLTRRSLAKFASRSLVASKKKHDWWKPFTRAAKAGDVFLLRDKSHREPKVVHFLAQLEGAPEHDFDDAWDAVAIAHQMVATKPTYDTKRLKKPVDKYRL